MLDFMSLWLYLDSVLFLTLKVLLFRMAAGERPWLLWKELLSLQPTLYTESPSVSA